MPGQESLWVPELESTPWRVSRAETVTLLAAKQDLHFRTGAGGWSPGSVSLPSVQLTHPDCTHPIPSTWHTDTKLPFKNQIVPELIQLNPVTGNSTFSLRILSSTEMAPVGTFFKAEIQAQHLSKPKPVSNTSHPLYISRKFHLPATAG